MSDIGIVRAGWELTETCNALGDSERGAWILHKTLMVFYQTWLERASAKLKGSGVWCSVQ